MYIYMYKLNCVGIIFELLGIFEFLQDKFPLRCAYRSLPLSLFLSVSLPKAPCDPPHRLPREFVRQVGSF